MKITDLKKLNPKKPGAWPWPVKIAAFVLIFICVIGAGFVFVLQDEWNNLQDAKADEDKLKEAFLVKKKQAINLDLIKKQLIETQESLGALLKQLPNQSEMDALLTDINQAGMGRGLQFDFFKPSPETVTGSFAVQPIIIKVTGNYDDIGKFASDIAMMPRIVTLNDITITPNATGLTMDATAKTFRYLSDAETAGQKQSGVKK